jgi:CRISPR-associated protein Csc2
MRSAINELDHILPEVTFPTVESLRDATYEGFVYVLGNLLRTKRYGAQESRTGTMKNHLVGIVFADGEIFSNLHLTQALYDQIGGELNKSISELCEAAATVAQDLLNKEPVRKSELIFGADLEALLEEVNGIYQNDAELTKLLGSLYQQTQDYATEFGALSSGKKKVKS